MLVGAGRVPLSDDVPAQGRRELPPCLAAYVASLDLRKVFHPAVGLAVVGLAVPRRTQGAPSLVETFEPKTDGRLSP